MPRLCIMPMSLQGPAHSNQRLHTSHLTATLNRDLNRASAKSGGYCFHQKLSQRMNRCHWTASALMMKSVYIPNDSPDWLDKPSPDRHLCIHDEHQDRCEHFRAPSRPDPTVTYNNPSGFMSLQDLEDMNILPNIKFSSDDELPDLS